MVNPGLPSCTRAEQRPRKEMRRETVESRNVEATDRDDDDDALKIS